MATFVHQLRRSAAAPGGRPTLQLARITQQMKIQPLRRHFVVPCYYRRPFSTSSSHSDTTKALAEAGGTSAKSGGSNNDRHNRNLSTTGQRDRGEPTDAIAITVPTSYTQTQYLKAFSELSKAKLSTLVVSTTAFGFLSAGSAISLPTLTAVSLGTALCSSSASTFNQIFELERDRKMKRTSHRPLVTGILTPSTAVALGTTTGLTGGTILLLGTDPITATLGVGNIALYAGLYTYLKPRSEWNTWVGAVVGAIPPVMGYTAAGGSPFDIEAMLLGSTLFLWQFPHFFALSYMHRKDYGRGGFDMVPVNDPSGDRTADLITRYSWYLSTLPLISTMTGVTSSMFAVEGLVLNGYALHVAHKFGRERTNANARKVFLTSLWYLPCFMTLFLLHSKTWRDDVKNEEKTKKSRVAGLEEELRVAIQRRISLIRNKGRELCVHEAVVVKEETKCPIVVGKKTAQDVTETGLQVASDAATATASPSEGS